MTLTETLLPPEPVTLADPLALLNALQGQPRWAWFSPDEIVVAWGQAAAIQGDDPAALTRQLDDLRRQGGFVEDDAVRLFGGLPFDRSGISDSLWEGLDRPRFVLPRYIYRQTADSGRLIALRPDDVPPLLPERPLPPLTPARWEDALDYPRWETMVNAARQAVAAGELEKVVFARSREVTFTRTPSLVTAFARLCQRYPQTYRFYFEPRPGHVFMGATPELLARARGLNLETVALAGSAPRGDTPAEDARLGAALLANEKDRREQAIVVERICDDLHLLCVSFQHPETPRLRRLPNIQHLETPVSARLRRPGVLAPVWALHPTPALAGQPRQAALRMIRRHEPTPRGLYGAPVGWITPEGDGVLAVAIRSAVFNGRRGRLYAGAGILAASQPEREWRETALKFRPMMEALGLEEA